MLAIRPPQAWYPRSCWCRWAIETGPSRKYINYTVYITILSTNINDTNNINYTVYIIILSTNVNDTNYINYTAYITIPDISVNVAMLCLRLLVSVARMQIENKTLRNEYNNYCM